MSTNQIIGLVVAAIIIIAGAWYLVKPHGDAMMQEGATATSTDMNDMSGDMTGSNTSGDGTVTTSTTTTTTTIPQPGQPVTITYTSKGFSPSTLSIREGTVVTFVNQSNNPMEVASDPHPSHTAYDGTTRAQHCTATGPTSTSVFDECVGVSAGGKWSFTFTKLGSWGFHNHLAPNMTGSITVLASQAASTTTTTQVKVNAQ